MIRLLRTELTRLRWRRAVLVLVGAAIVVPLVILGATAWSTRPISPAEQSAALAQVEQDSKDPSFRRDLRNCLRKPDLYGVAEDAHDADAQCREITQPQADWYFFREPLDLVEQEGQSGVGVIVILATAMLLIGSTFAGHDWNTGSISNQLLFEPRRQRTWAAKGAAVLLVGLLVAGLVVATFWTGLWLVARQRGLAPRSSDILDVYFSGMRGVLFVAVAGLAGYAITMLFRSTVATLGILVAVAVIGPLLITLLGFEGNERVMPQYNFLAVVLDGFVIDDFGENCAGGVGTADIDGLSCTTRISTIDGSLYYGVILVGVVGASMVLFQRRDVIDQSR